MTLLYVNRITGVIDEVDGDSFLIDTDDLADPNGFGYLDAEEMVDFAEQAGIAQEISR